MKNLVEYLKELGAVKASVVKGPNGAFISATKEGFVDRTTTPELAFTLPVGKKSVNGKISEMNVLFAADSGQAIATVNQYEELDSMSL